MSEQKLKTVNIKGKNYVQVNERVKAFRNEPVWKGYSIVTEMHELTDDVCVMCAKVLDPEGHVVATGWAREVRNDAASMVNKTSYVENCETSAVGRALGFFGIGIDEQICSAQELLYALQAQDAAPAAPVVTKGGAVYPAKEPERTKEEKPSGEELDAIYNSLMDRERDEYNDACRQMKGALLRNDIVLIYNRYIHATFAPLLLDFGNKQIKEKGLK